MSTHLFSTCLIEQATVWAEFDAGIVCNRSKTGGFTTGEAGLALNDLGLRLNERLEAIALMQRNKSNGWYVDWSSLLGECEIYALVIEDSWSTTWKYLALSMLGSYIPIIL